jgi:hypothetical protein
MNRTNTDEEMAAAEEAHSDDPERAELVHRARVFKSSWIELAQALTEARRNGRWKDWGFDSFEAYAKCELHLRQETVDKLTGSYQFLQRRAPEVLSRDGMRAPIPSYQSIDFLRRAEARSDAPSDAVQAIRKKVIEENAPVTAVARQFNDVVFPIDEADRRARDAAGIKNVAKKLRELLGDTRAVSKTLAREVSADLDRLLEALADKTEKERAA